MHIPDGYLSPRTCAVFFVAMAPVWYYASRSAQKSLGPARLPYLSLTAAFSFVIMMFNVPLPGGTTGHLSAGALSGILLGPWGGVLAMSVTVVLQAVIFGDGGILSLGANAFNLAFVAPVGAYAFYSLFAGPLPAPKRSAVSAGVAAYLAVNLCAFSAALQLGMQPVINVGGAVYSPYPLSITIPALLVPHILFIGPIESLATALIVSYVQRGVEAGHNKEPLPPTKRLWAVLGALIILTPLGLIASGTPWGEWGASEVAELIGYAPSGMEALGGIWDGVLPGYSRPSGNKALYYVLSAAIGSAVVTFILYLWARSCRR